MVSASQKQLQEKQAQVIHSRASEKEREAGRGDMLGEWEGTHFLAGMGGGHKRWLPLVERERFLVPGKRNLKNFQFQN